MILMGVAALRAEHHLRIRSDCRNSLRSILDPVPMGRRPAVAAGRARSIRRRRRGRTRRARPAPRLHARSRRRPAPARRTRSPGVAARRSSSVPPIPIAMSSQCAPTTAISVSSLGGESDHRTLARSAASTCSHSIHGRSPLVVPVVELGPLLEGVGGLPESVVLVAEQPSLAGQRAADVRDEITSGREQVENLLARARRIRRSPRSASCDTAMIVLDLAGLARRRRSGRMTAAERPSSKRRRRTCESCSIMSSIGASVQHVGVVGQEVLVAVQVLAHASQPLTDRRCPVRCRTNVIDQSLMSDCISSTSAAAHARSRLTRPPGSSGRSS